MRGSGGGFRVQAGSGFRVQGSGFRVQGSGFRVQGAGFRVQGPGSRFQGSGIGFRERGLVGRSVPTRKRAGLPTDRTLSAPAAEGVSAFGFWDSGFGLRV